MAEINPRVVLLCIHARRSNLLHFYPRSLLVLHVPVMEPVCTAVLCISAHRCSCRHAGRVGQCSVVSCHIVARCVGLHTKKRAFGFDPQRLQSNLYAHPRARGPTPTPTRCLVTHMPELTVILLGLKSVCSVAKG